MRPSSFKIFIFLLLILGNTSTFEPSAAGGVDQASRNRPLKNWGLINFEASSHIQALDAWKIEEGNRNIIVAVIDTGVDSEQPALSANIWHDQNNKNIYGWNFVTDQPNPKDAHGHGTHVAGIIGAMTDPVSGVSGVAHRVSIMPVKYYSETNSGAVNLENTVKAIKYAVKHGARIINYSGGGPVYNADEYQAIKEAQAQGVLFVSAAGNEHQNTDEVENHYFPSAYGLPNIIVVAATDIHNRLLPTSNWGKKKVDLAAPGNNIYSTLPNGRFGYMSGTSQATAFVSGVAALLLAHNPRLTFKELKEIIMTSVDHFPHLQDKIAAGGRVNAYQALLTLQKRDLASPELSWIAQSRSSFQILQNPQNLSPL